MAISNCGSVGRGRCFVHVRPSVTVRPMVTARTAPASATAPTSMREPQTARPSSLGVARAIAR